MPQQAPHPLDQKEASTRRKLPFVLGAAGLLVAALGGWALIDRGPTEPLEIDALIAPPIYTNGALFPLTEGGNLPTDPPRILTLEPGARLMLRVKHAPDAPELVWREQAQQFARDQDGAYWLTMTIDEPGVLSLRQGDGQGHDWLVSLTPDDPPHAGFASKPFVTARQMLRFDIEAEDDFGLAGLELTIAPASDADSPDIEPVSLTLPPADLSGPFRDTIYVDLRDNALAGQMARVWVTARDRHGQKSLSEPHFLRLPERRYRVAEARILASQPGKLRDNPGKTTEVATILHTIATRHMAAQMDGDGLDAGRFLAFSVAYSRLTGQPLLTDKPFRPPLFPASHAQIEEASPIIMALATEIEDGKLAETDPLFMQADKRLQDLLGPDASPEEQDAALWQYRYALSRHLPTLLLTSLSKQGYFLPAPLGSDSRQMFVRIDQVSQQIGQDMEDGDWQRARTRLGLLRDVVHGAQAGTGAGERADNLGLMTQIGAMLTQVKQLQKEAIGDRSRLASLSGKGQADRAVTVLPFRPLTKKAAIARAEALYYRSNRHLADHRVETLLPTLAQQQKGPHIKARHALNRAYSAFRMGEMTNAVSYLGQAEKHLAALSQMVATHMITQASSIPPTPLAVLQSRALPVEDYNRFLALLSAHRDLATNVTLGKDDHAEAGAQFTQAMNLTGVLPPPAPVTANPASEN